jgi:hypothetical protein
MPFGNRLRQCLALSLTVSILSLSFTVADAGTANTLGSLRSTGEVYLNGSKAISGVTVFTGSRITTTAKSSAIVNLSQLSRLSIPPESGVNLSFSDAGVNTELLRGRVSLFAPKGVSYSVATPYGSVVADGSCETRFSVRIEEGRTFVITEAGQVEISGTTNDAGMQVVAAGQHAMMGAAAQASNTTRNNLSGEQKVAIGIGIGVGAAFLIWLVARDDANTDLDFGGPIENPSPFF